MHFRVTVDMLSSHPRLVHRICCALGISQDFLAERSGVDISTIKRWRSGDSQRMASKTADRVYGVLREVWFERVHYMALAAQSGVETAEVELGINIPLETRYQWWGEIALDTGHVIEL